MEERTAMKPDEKTSERTLILCIDRDDDLGVKAGIKTPVLGREENLNAAVSLALRDPEEPDANAIFEAIRIYDRLNEGTDSKGRYQIATITGSELGGIEADRKLVAELTQVLERFPAEDVILVSDGYSDEAVLPLVQSRVPVTSVRRIVVKHSESIEETAALFSKYLKLLVETPRYSRIVLGLPGILLIIIGLLYVYNLLAYAWIAFLIILGSVLLVKGFRLDSMAKRLYIWAREYSPPPMSRLVVNFSIVAGVLLVGLGLYQGSYQVTLYITTLENPPLEIGQWISLLPKLSGEFILGSINIIVFGVCILLSGRAIRWYFERDPRMLRTIGIVTVVAWTSQILYEAGEVLKEPALGWIKLALSIVIGMILAIVVVLVIIIVHRKYASFFEGRKIDELAEG